METQTLLLIALIFDVRKVIIIIYELQCENWW